MRVKEFYELENDIYQCLYDQGLHDINQCKYFDQCQACRDYIDEVERRYPIIHVDRNGEKGEHYDISPKDMTVDNGGQK